MPVGNYAPIEIIILMTMVMKSGNYCNANEQLCGPVTAMEIISEHLLFTKLNGNDDEQSMETHSLLSIARI